MVEFCTKFCVVIFFYYRFQTYVSPTGELTCKVLVRSMDMEGELERV